MKTQVEIAREIATAAHEGQIDKAGRPYIEHPAHVAAALAGQGADEVIQAAAWLHDVVEATPLTFDDLAAHGVAPQIIDALRLLTHDKSVPYMDYIRAIGANPMARAVKLADLCHNSDLSRIAAPTATDYQRVEKYQQAIALLKTVKMVAL